MWSCGIPSRFKGSGRSGVTRLSAIPVKALCGIGSIPNDRTSASQWLRRASVPLHTGKGSGGRFEYVLHHDLPSEVRRAYTLHEIEAAELPVGVHDEAAHDRFAEATPAM